MPQKMNSGKSVLRCGDARYDVTGQRVEPRWLTGILMAKKRACKSIILIRFQDEPNPG